MPWKSIRRFSSWENGTRNILTVIPAFTRISPMPARLATEQKDLPLRQFVESKRSAFLDSPPVPLTTDNWPYLYQDQRTIPAVFFVLSLLVIIVATGFYLRIPNARSRMPSLFFFSMGVGFLLLETQVVSRLALYFGTTWQ